MSEFRGDPSGSDPYCANAFGRTGITPGKAGGTGRRFMDAKMIAKSLGEDFVGTVVKPGFLTHGFSGGVRPANKFINENYEKGDTLIIYGYSYGGDAAVNLSEKTSKKINLLITIDSSDGGNIFGNMTVDNSINDDIKNLNIYQRNPSGKPLLERLGCKSDFCKSRRKLPGSRGSSNTGKNVTNVDLTGLVTHGNIQDKAKHRINSEVLRTIKDGQ